MLNLQILKNKYLYKNFSFISSRVIIKYGINIFTLLLVTRIFTPEEYGFVVFIASIIGFFSFFGLKGMDVTISRNIAKGRDYIFMEASRKSLIFSLLIFPLFLILSYYYIIQEVSTVYLSLLFLSIIIPFSLFFKKSVSFMDGKKRFFRLSIFNIISSTNGFLAIGILYFFNYKVWHYIVLSHFLSMLFYLFLFINSLKFIVNHKIGKVEEKHITEELSYGYNLSKISLINHCISYIDKLIVAFFVGIVSLASYSIALRFFEMISETIRSLAQIPSIRLAEKSKENYSLTLKKYLPLVLFVSLVICLTIFISAPYLIKYFFPDYEKTGIYIQYFSLVFLFQPTNRLIGKYFLLTKNSNAIFLITTSSNILLVILYSTLFYYFGIIGLLYSYVIVSIYSFFLELLLFYDKINLENRINLFNN